MSAGLYFSRVIHGVTYPGSKFGLSPDLIPHGSTADHDVYACCLATGLRVRWLPGPMWWHHDAGFGARDTCLTMLHERAPWKRP